MRRGIGAACALVLGFSACAPQSDVEELRIRVQRLEREVEAQRQGQALLLRALEHTTAKLDEFLRRVRPPGSDSETAEPEARAPQQAPAIEPPPPALDAESENAAAPASGTSRISPWWWGTLPALVVAALALLSWRARRRAAIDAAAHAASHPPRNEGAGSDHGDETDPRDQNGVEAHVPAELLAGLQVDAPPPAHCLELEHARPGVLRDAVERWLEDDPRVLVHPAPRVTVDGPRLCARYHLAPEVTAAEAVRVEAELTQLATLRGATSRLPEPPEEALFLDGKDEEPSYTPRPSQTPPL